MLSHGALKTDPFDRNVEGNVFDRKDCLDLPFFFRFMLITKTNLAQIHQGLRLAKINTKTTKHQQQLAPFMWHASLKALFFFSLLLKEVR